MREDSALLCRIECGKVVKWYEYVYFALEIILFIIIIIGHIRYISKL